MIDLEVALAERFGWSLRDIDETDVESLMGFVRRVAGKQVSEGKGQVRRDKRLAYCDEVDWL